MMSDAGAWELWRGDEAGHQVLVARHGTRGHAQMQLAALESEARQKQVYWVKPRGGAEIR
jgi:hypothetical protein